MATGADMANLAPAKVRITRTALGGAADAAIEEASPRPRGVLREVRVKRTQTAGLQTCRVLGKNDGGRFNTYAPGDSLKVEILAGEEEVYLVGLDGVLAQPAFEPGRHPGAAMEVIGWNFLLDQVTVQVAKEYLDTAYTSIVDDVRTTLLSGWANAITTDPATIGRWRIEVGMTLRAVLDQLRLALIAATSTVWEYELAINATTGTKELKWYKTSVSVVRTVQKRHLRKGSHRIPGNIAEIINKVKVVGATLPTEILDKSTLAQAGLSRIDAAGIRLAMPVKAKDNPLYALAMQADRSVGKTPPTLKASFARNSDNVNVLRDNKLLNKAKLERANLTGTDGAMNDGDQNTSENLADPGGAFVKLAVFDYGAGGVAIAAGRVIANVTTSGAVYELRLSYSDDNVSYTVFATFQVVSLSPAKDTVEKVLAAANSVTKRYWKWEGRTTTPGGSCQIFEVELYPFKNLGDDNTLSDTVDKGRATSTGAVTRVLMRWDMRAVKGIPKFSCQHNEQSTDALIKPKWQKKVGSDWIDIAVLSPVNGAVIDTIFIEEPDFQELRFAVVDGRSGGSGSLQFDAEAAKIYWETTTVTGGASPSILTGDKLIGSEVSWGVEGLRDHPGMLEEKTYPAPRLAQVTDRPYWLWLEAGAGVGTDAFWDISYATDATYVSGLAGAVRSTDSGSTWANVAANAILRLRLEWNNTQITAEAQDNTSIAKYASLVPGGIFYATIYDETITTKDMAAKVASGIIHLRKDIRDRGVIVTPLDHLAEVGKRLKLVHEAAQEVGLSAESEYDIHEFEHVITADDQGGLTFWYVGEHPPGDPTGYLGAIASNRRF